MRGEGNSLDLNNLPEDYYTRDTTQASGDSSSSAAGGGGGYGKKKSGGKDEEKEEAGKVYECRFCSLKFCKSQALGGHMNRHRQERETETLNKARQLVFSNDLATPHLGYVPSSGQAISHGGYHHQAITNNMDDTSLPFRSMYPSRMFSATSSLIPPPPPPPQIYPPPPPPQLLPIPPQYPSNNDYYVGHVVTNSCYGAAPNGSYYTCVGAPVGHGSASGGGGGGGGGRDLSPHNQQEEGLNWGRR